MKRASAQRLLITGLILLLISGGTCAAAFFPPDLPGEHEWTWLFIGIFASLGLAGAGLILCIIGIVGYVRVPRD